MMLLNTAQANSDIDVEKNNNLLGTSQANTHRLNHATRLTLEQYRVLVGIPQDHSRCTFASNNRNDHNGPFQHDSIGNGTNHLCSIPPPTIRSSVHKRSFALGLLGFLSRLSHWDRSKDDQSERATSMYFSLRQEESDQSRMFHIYNFVTYTCLILQLIIASALIVLGAIPNATQTSDGDDVHTGYRIAVAVLGGVVGVLTGILSLLKGQGLPNRFLQYASRLRHVREQIELKERVLRANLIDEGVTYRDVLKIWQDYENVLIERDMNRPDAWAPLGAQPIAQSTDISGNVNASAGPALSDPDRGTQMGQNIDVPSKS